MSQPLQRSLLSQERGLKLLGRYLKLLVHWYAYNSMNDLFDFFICCVVVNLCNHCYASFLCFSYEEIILRDIVIYLLFTVLD